MQSSYQVVNSLNETVGAFKSRVNVKISSVESSTTSIQSTADKIYAGVQRFKTDMLQNEEKQIAHENIIRIDQIVKEQFSEHETIRRTVMGIVRDFDINLVRNSTIQEMSEELWITSSRYWLSYAMMAISAWVNNYPEIAQNALAESGRRDAVKTTLFFCLMNLRFQRVDVAKMWFCEYLKSLDPTMLQQETAVLIQSYLNGVFGKDQEMEHQVIRLIDEWMSIIREDAVASQEIVNAYASYINNTFWSGKFPYSTLKNHCINVQELKKSYAEVSKYDLLISFVNSLDVENEEQSEANYKSRIDAILIDLISKYDAEELELKNEQEYYRLVVQNNGMLDRAQQQYEARQELNNIHFNIGGQLVNWAVYDNTADVHVRKFGLVNTKRWFVEAIEQWSMDMREKFSLEYKLQIDTWSGTSNGEDQPQQMEIMKKYYENCKFQIVYANIPNIAAALVLLASVGLAFISLYSLVGTGLALGFLVFNILRMMKIYPARVSNAMNTLSNCMTELTEFRQYFEENKTKKDTLINDINFM